MMKLQNVALADVVPNPWRDMRINPIDDDHVRELRDSINEHGFFGGIKGRRRGGKIELGCGHARIIAARKAKLDTVPIYIDDIDDDAMLRLMTDENATQAGASPGAVLNEVAAVTQRLIEGLLSGTGTNVPVPVAKAFENKTAVLAAIGKLRNGRDAHLTLGHNVIARYLGEGNAERSNRKERQIRDAITTLKQSGRYDDLVEEAISKFPPPAVADKPAAKTREVATTTPKQRRPVIYDDRCSHLFSGEHQAHAFREAVITPGAQRVIAVDQQLKLAKSIASEIGGTKKYAGAPFIKRLVQDAVQVGLREQREIDQQEREAYLAEQREERIDNEIQVANASVRSVISIIGKLADLADEFPAHPKITGFAARLDLLAQAIKRFSDKLR
jgi:hypothetical protein